MTYDTLRKGLEENEMNSYSVAMLERGITEDGDGHPVWSNSYTVRRYSVEAVNEDQAIEEVMAWGLHPRPLRRGVPAQ